ncbi:PLP-dependent aminotransferase family protein [Sellimonas caecigallum]|uniref:PLP-dependent aminotransferase family protein n=1 Tax=Sellimonas caecigallum TaxID=2592333 RepID=A0ABS7L6D5_9FIRM|nr:PLP-dependent aminotransferase family protein [Sellimonas caecigallum]MBY0758623.1 PLP-dependent aminotransferase family protein [Sellimonas caecigallum]
MNELTIHLESRSGAPLYEQIYNYIKNDIQRGQIPAREKLPSTRSLAKYLEVSRSTVELAYEQLLSEGYIESVPYKGFFVMEVEDLYQIQAIREPRREGGEKKETCMYDFSPNGVDLKKFPYHVWRKLSKDVLCEDRAELFRLGDPQGEYGLRNVIAAYLHQARGVNCTPEQIIVGAGNDYMLFLLHAILGNGHKAAFENPTYKQAYRLFGRLGYPVCTVDMDKSGMEVEKLRKMDADIAYVMPSHQYPLGIVMPIRRRMELLSWAKEKEGRFIIEDDYDSEFRYKGKPIPALKGFDMEEKVIYLGTFSKSIAPAIRMSYMVLPLPLLEVYRETCRFINPTVSRVDQMILQKFIEDGHYERHLNRMRAIYKSRHDILLGCLKPFSRICRISGENAGVHLLLTFDDGRTEEELIRQAKEQGIRVCGLSSYDAREQKRGKASVILGYANLEEKKIVEAVEILKKIWIP